MKCLSKPLVGATALLWSVTHAFACAPEPGVTYDDITSTDVTLAVAKVRRVEFFHQNSVPCHRVDYEVVQLLYGSADTSFEVTTCYASANWQWDKSQQQIERLAEHLGFEPGADIFLGLASDKDHEGLRYLIPSCWGPLHAPLDQLSQEEQAELLDSVSELVIEQ